MKKIYLFFMVFFIFSVWLPYSKTKTQLGEVPLERAFSTQGTENCGWSSLLVLCSDVWSERIRVRRRPRRPYRKPRKPLTEEELQRIRAWASRMQQGKAKAKGSALKELKKPVVGVSAAVGPVCDSHKAGRPATVPTNHVFCPYESCRGYGQVGPHPNHRIVGDGTYKTSWNKIRQMFRCELCGKCFSETRCTVFFGLKTPEETVYRALAALAEGVSIRSTARIFEVRVETILLWLKRAGDYCEQVSSYLMRNLQVTHAQLDELWTFVYKKQKKLSSWEKLHTEYGDMWIWTVVDPVHKLVLAFLIGDREEAQAEGVLKKLKATLVEGCLPLLTSDSLPHYLQAILKVFGRWVQPERNGTRGRFPKERLEPCDGLHYATVHKEHQKGRVVSVTTRIVFGKASDLLARLRALGMKKVNTSFVERMNLTLRHLVSRLRRRGLTFSKKKEFLEWHMQLAVAYYHFVRTHRSLRQRLPQPIPTKGNGSPKIWQKRTPAMSAGLTDHIWTIQELLMFRVPRAPATCV